MGWKARNHSGDPCFLDFLHKGETEAGGGFGPLPQPPSTRNPVGDMDATNSQPSLGPSAWLVPVQFPGNWVSGCGHNGQWGARHPMDSRVGC